LDSSSDPGTGPGTGTEWISENIPNKEALRLACVRACREGISPNRFIALSPVESRVSRLRRIQSSRFKGFGDVWTGAIRCAALASSPTKAVGK